MAQHETREIASYLRDGSLWVGHFVSNGELNFGDDRFDAASGLAKFLYADATISTDPVNRQAEAGNRCTDQAGEVKTTKSPRLDETAEPLKLAA